MYQRRLETLSQEHDAVVAKGRRDLATIANLTAEKDILAAAETRLQAQVRDLTEERRRMEKLLVRARAVAVAVDWFG